MKKVKVLFSVGIIALSGVFYSLNINQANASAGSCWFDTAGGCDSGGWVQCTDGACDGDVVIIKPKN